MSRRGCKETSEGGGESGRYVSYTRETDSINKSLEILKSIKVHSQYTKQGKTKTYLMYFKHKSSPSFPPLIQA